MVWEEHGDNYKSWVAYCTLLQLKGISGITWPLFYYLISCTKLCAYMLFNELEGIRTRTDIVLQGSFG
jgi:hypothetical protein